MILEVNVVTEQDVIEVNELLALVSVEETPSILEQVLIAERLLEE
jgi:hypothetical protein